MKDTILLKTIRGEMTERPPVWFMRQAGRVLPSYLKLREKYSFKELMRDPELAAEVTLLPVHDLGVDAAILFSDILVVPEALGMELNFLKTGPKFQNPIYQANDPLGNIKPDATKLEYIYKVIDEILIKIPSGIPLIGFCGSPFTTFCYMVEGIGSSHSFQNAVAFFYKRKKETKALLDIITDMSVEYAVNQAKHGISVFQIFETHAGLIPCDIYFEIVMPFVRKLSSALRQKNVPVIFFPKGLGMGIKNITPADTDFLGVDWQTSIWDARKYVHPDIGLQGNLDPRLLFAGTDNIEESLNKYIDFGANEQKWIFNLGHGLMPGIPFQNTKFVVDWIKETNWKRK